MLVPSPHNYRPRPARIRGILPRPAEFIHRGVFTPTLVGFLRPHCLLVLLFGSSFGPLEFRTASSRNHSTIPVPPGLHYPRLAVGRIDGVLFPFIDITYSRIVAVPQHSKLFLMLPIILGPVNSFSRVFRELDNLLKPFRRFPRKLNMWLLVFTGSHRPMQLFRKAGGQSRLPHPLAPYLPSISGYLPLCYTLQPAPPAVHQWPVVSYRR